MHLGLLLATLAIAMPPGGAAAGVSLFRPLIADPRENQSRWRMMAFTEDWRYGTDITDSTTVGGYEEDRRGIGWEISAGETFRWRPLARVAGFKPWRRYQIGAPAGMFADFDGTGSLLVTDYQFGVSFDVLWNGPYSDTSGTTGFDHPVVTSRTAISHRSSHLGDEYVTLSGFGRNQQGHPAAAVLFAHPPVKRVELSYEALDAAVSVEWAPPFLGGGSGTLRAYGGGTAKIILPERWHIGGNKPRQFRSPAARLGLEYRSAGNRPDPAPGWVAAALNKVARDRVLGSSWYAALDLRLAKPFEFASCDNPDGHTEVWTPHLWTECPYGREFARYAGSWHGMIGAVLTPRGPAPGRRVGPEWLVSLEWYRGYSPHGQFLDQKLRYRPRGYVIPSVTAHF